MDPTQSLAKPEVPDLVMAALKMVLVGLNTHFAHLAPEVQKRYINALMDLGIWLYKIDQTYAQRSPRDAGLWNGSKFRTLQQAIFSKNQAEVDGILQWFIVKNSTLEGTSCDDILDAMATVRPIATKALEEADKILKLFPGLEQELCSKSRDLKYLNVWLHLNAADYGISVAEVSAGGNRCTIPRLYQFIVWEDHTKADLVLACFKRETLGATDEAAIAVSIARNFFERKVGSQIIAAFFRAFEGQ
jgi:hypothetical protein